MHAVLILNPASGISTITALEGVQSSPEENEVAILACLKAHNIEAEVQYTTLEDTGHGLAAQAARNQEELVIVAGGDGTIHAVASGLIDTETALGIIPTGTMNNLARSLHIPETVEEACAVIAEGRTQAIDVGTINDHIFIEVAGIGLEAALFPAAEEFKSPGLWSTLHGMIHGLYTLLAYHPTTLRIALDTTKRRATNALQVTICNAPFYGAHLQAAPEAVMDDGFLDIVIYRHFSKFAYVRHAYSISRGKRAYQPKIRHCRARALHITSSVPVEIQADGVVYGHTPAAVRVLPEALRVRVPAPVDSAASALPPQEREASIHAR